VSTLIDLEKHARFLRNASPSAFQGFCTAFADYTERQYETLVDSPPDNLQRAQGHAQQCKAIFQALEKAKNG